MCCRMESATRRGGRGVLGRTHGRVHDRDSTASPAGRSDVASVPRGRVSSVFAEGVLAHVCVFSLVFSHSFLRFRDLHIMPRIPPQTNYRIFA